MGRFLGASAVVMEGRMEPDTVKPFRAKKVWHSPVIWSYATSDCRVPMPELLEASVMEAWALMVM